MLGKINVFTNESNARSSLSVGSEACLIKQDTLYEYIEEKSTISIWYFSINKHNDE